MPSVASSHKNRAHLIFIGFILAILVSFTVPCARAQTTPEQFKALAWDTSHAGTPLDLTGYKPTFHDGFDTMDITAADGAGPWYAAVHSPFGSGIFLPPGPEGIYTVKDGLLTLRSQKVNGQWQSGLIQTVDKNGHGFAQQYGYFEMKAQFPKGKGTWPAFWLLTQNGFLDPTKTRGEIDIVEWYGSDPTHDHSSLHLWPAKQRQPGMLEKHLGLSHITKLSPDVLVDGQLPGFHTYGALVTPDWIITYFDRKELERHPTLDEYKTPMYLLINLAITEKDADLVPNPIEMQVDEVSAWAR
jgi:beta-glucanase (GH16 family)